MQTLEKALRNKLEKTIKDARDIAEDAAKAALESLGVGEPTAYPHLTEDDRKLRRKLRAHGRQLGNGRDAKGRQELDRLIEEVAYEHWHRMLFARFLAENNLLMYPDPDDPVAVSLEECEDLAADEDAQNGWELAARFAARMLPQIFRPDSPVFQLILPLEYQQELERLITDLSQEVFTASDSLGWVYQFWQAKKKDEVNASEVKIGARELPAVTQLFTEPYMVSFLLDNSLGAWWAARHLSEADLKNANSEEELRNKAAIPGVPLEYLRFVKQDNGFWTTAAGTFDSWPEHLSELKSLDPCCGSGHFLVAAFLMLVPMRIELEGLTASEAVDLVLSENIHGLELDQHCVELAAFNLALTAWCYPGAGSYRQLPKLNVACSGLAITNRKEEWIALARDNTNLRMALEELYKQFKDAPVLGSLIDLEVGIFKGSLLESRWDDVEPLLKKALSGEQDNERAEMGVVAHGIVKSASLLAKKFDWIITNVPYLGKGKMSDKLKTFVEKTYFEGRADLSAVFIQRCLKACTSKGVVNIVAPLSWMYQASYKSLRKGILQKHLLHFMAKLGPNAFEKISGEVVNVGLFSIRRQHSENAILLSLDVNDKADINLKKDGLIKDLFTNSKLSSFLHDADYLIAPGSISDLPRLNRYSHSLAGINCGDSFRFQRNFWEFSSLPNGWCFQQCSSDATRLYSGMNLVFPWNNGEGEFAAFVRSLKGRLGGSWRRGEAAWGKKGIAVSRMGSLHSSLYTGELFDQNIAVIYLEDEKLLPAIWLYVASGEFSNEVRNINPNLAVSNSVLAQVPFNLDHWSKIAKENYPNGLPKPNSDNPTQWIFHGHPAQSDEPLQVAIARLFGYRWPAEIDPEMELFDESCAWVKKAQVLLSFADEDGIVCIPPVRGEMKAEDRLENLLAAAYGRDWSSNKKAELLAQVGHVGKTLDTWLRDKFFTQHCKLFQHRPFIWHIWDGLNDGFAVLVNYHKLNAKLLETLIYTYLGDWISRQKQDIGNGVDGAREKLAAAEALKKKLELILEGEAPHDIFVRWKPIEKQPIGWHPDLNDGVRLNIRPFMTVGDIKKKGAGILRDKPNIKWAKDRGKDVKSAPWYHLFKGDRINDHHLTLNEKLEALRENRK